jgi:predicted protein tyrosine phosphatase
MEARAPRVSLLVALAAGCLAGPALAAAWHWGRILGTLNQGVVVPGHVYRSAQPSAKNLAWLVRRYGVRTVINLRGHAQTTPWYLEEATAGAELGLSQEDITMSASRLPSPLAVRQLVEALDLSPRPILIHCQQGVDRTGLAAASALLLYTDTPLDEAERSMSLGTGHVPLGRTRFIRGFFRQYREWLAGLELEHRPGLFRYWATRVYAPEGTPADWHAEPAVPQPGGQALVQARCRNLSSQAWRMRAEPGAGYHAWWHVVDDNGILLGAGLTGLRDAIIRPGEEAEMPIVLPRLPRGKKCVLRAQMVTPGQGTFTQLGSPPLEMEVVLP